MIYAGKGFAVLGVTVNPVSAGKRWSVVCEQISSKLAM